MTNNSIRLIAPFRCQFNIDTSKTIQNNDKFNAFLKKFNNDFSTAKSRDRMGVPEGIFIEAITHASRDLRYVSLNAVSDCFNASQYLSIKFMGHLQSLLENSLKDALQNADNHCKKKLSSMLFPIWESVDVSICDNTIGILRLDLIIDRGLDHDEWEAVDEWTTHLVFYFLDNLYKNYIYPTLNAVNRYAETYSDLLLCHPHSYFVFYDMCGEESDPSDTHLLWVNRTLITAQVQGASDWIMKGINNSDIIDVDGAHVHLNWGNNIIKLTSSEHSPDLSAVWQGMYLAQYYYASMDIIGSNLKRFIACHYDTKTDKELRLMSRKLDAVINSVTLFQVEYKDLSKEIQGTPKTIFRCLEKAWDFEILVHNVHDKCELCRSNAQLISAYINQRNSIRVEIVMMSVMGVGFLGLMANLSSYSRALAREGYNYDALSLLNLAQMLSPDGMIWVGLTLAISITLFVIINRS